MRACRSDIEQDARITHPLKHKLVVGLLIAGNGRLRPAFIPNMMSMMMASYQLAGCLFNHRSQTLKSHSLSDVQINRSMESARGPIRAPSSGGLRALLCVVLLSAALCCATGCVSPRYKQASKKTPPPVMLNVNFPPAPLEASLVTLIVSGGPGSWKKEAFWDEYVATFRNSADRPLQVGSVVLVDGTGVPQYTGEDPWKLERESKSLERRYRDAGMTVVRIAAPRALVTAAEPPAVASAGIGAAGAATAATATAVALPVYGATVLSLNLHNKKAIKKEFNRRRLSLPLVLAPGETRVGSLFFPLVPNPRSLIVTWSSESANGDSQAKDVLPLDFLRGLHVKEATAVDAAPNPSPP
jgi:hypothetical protein